MTTSKYAWPVLAWRPDGEPRQIIVEDFEIVVNDLTLRVPSGWDDFDGASIPRWLWNAIGHPFMRQFVRASLIHDYLYGCPESRDRPVLDDRAKADALFYDMLRLDGVRRPKAKLMRWAVEAFGADRYVAPGSTKMTVAQCAAREQADCDCAEEAANALLAERDHNDPELVEGIDGLDWVVIRALLRR